MNLKIISSKKAKVLSLIVAGLALILFAINLNIVKASESFNYNINVNYAVNSSGSTAVKETYSITNKTSTQYLDSIKVSTPSADISNIQVYYTNGGNIPFETAKLYQESGGYKYDYTQITVNFNRANVGQGLNWGFVIQYDSPGLVENKGRANVVYIPGISADSRDDYNVSLTVPSDFGQIHGFGKLPNLVYENSSVKTFQFSKDDLFNNSVQLLFGDSTTYKGEFIYSLKNESNSSADYEITLPPSTASQQSFVEKISPEPVSTRVDGDGNVIAKYRLLGKQSIDVKADILADVKYIQYDLSNSGVVEDIPQSLKTQYTKPTKYWQADNPAIKQKARELTADKKSVAEKIKAINDYVVQTLNYNNEKIKYNVRQGGLEALNNPNNVVCLEYSDLTISLLRAADIPARMPVGYGYSGDLKKSPAVSDSLHSWVQAYVPNNGWINLDPTWGEKFNNFGISDIDHLAFAIWGESDSSPVASTQNGIDTNYEYENVKLTYTKVVPTVANDAKIKSTNWVILPFISVNDYRLTAPTNATIFQANIKLSDGSNIKSKDIKTLAPSQKINGLVFNLGLSFNKYNKISLLDSSGNKELASNAVVNNYLPLILIAAVILSVILIVSVVKLRNNKSKKKSNKQDEPKEN